MKIQSSSILMSGKSTSIQQYSKDESLKAWVGRRPVTEINNSKPPNHLTIQLDILKLSEQAKKELETQKRNAALASQQQIEAQGTNEVKDDNTFNLSDEAKAKILMIQKMLEKLTGKRLKFFFIDDIKIKPTDLKINKPVALGEVRASNDWGLEYNYHESYYEKSKMSFSSEGKVKTADGREIDFSVQLNMSREFMYNNDISIKAGNAKVDPLVINFDGKPPALTNTKFSFDLDADGNKDQISFVGPGSGFLALDKNNDGKINDGSELFGPQSGNGFQELENYDSDKNGWIDENDPIYNNLRIWTKDSEGNDKLFAIGEKGIGAIYLGNVDTSYEMKNSNNDSMGEIKRTGIFLKENGTPGTIQHIDLAL